MKIRHGTELPGSLKEIFDNKDAEYRLLQDYKEPDMDNIQALRWLIEELSISGDFIEVDDGTQIVLNHPDYDYTLIIDSRGLGDTHSHAFEVSIFKTKKW